MPGSIAIGTHSRWFEEWIDADAGLAFANATNEPNDDCVSGRVVPPLFTSSIILPAMAEVQRGISPEAIAGATVGVHAEHQVVFHRPLEARMTVKVRAVIHSARQTPAGALIAIRIDVTDLDEQLIRQHYWVNMEVGGRLVEGPVGPALPAHTFPEEARAGHFGTYRVDIDADQAFRYAGVTDESPPHSLDDRAARLEGFSGKILQGMCTFAMCGGGIVKLGADGDASRLVRLAGRFARPCYPKHELRVELYDAGRSDEGHRRIAWDAMSQQDTVIKHGLAEIAD